jgi:hypothetical protein
MGPHSIFNEADYTNIIHRIQKLTPSTQAQWGKMNVAQMLAHCNIVHKQALGLMPVGKSPNFLLRFLIKRIILSPKQYKPGLPTGRELVMSDTRDFEREKQEMLKYLGDIYKKGPDTDWPRHQAVGKISGKEWGWAMWKHLDHHLRQFGA